jgi:hypothetical protein
VTTTNPHEDLPRLRPIATAYRMLVMLVGLNILLWIGSNPGFTGTGVGGKAIHEVCTMGALLIPLVIAVKGYQLASLLRRAVPVLWAVGMVIPLINLVVLLALSSASQAFCTKYGIPVGLLGPNMVEVARLEAAFQAAQAQRAQQASQAPQAP